MTGSKKYRYYYLLGLAVLMAVAWSGLLDVMARGFATDGIIQAGTYYGTIRFLNATVSMFQEVEINFLVSQLAIGQLLDPVNDLVEFVSEGLKLALGSYLLQRVVIEVVSTALFNGIFTVSAVAYAAAFFAFSEGIKNLIFKVFISLAFLRFSVIVLMLATTAFSSSFLDEKIEDERVRTQNLSSELNETRKATSNVSDDLANTIHADIRALESRKADLVATMQPRREEIREARYQIHKNEQAIATIKDRLGVVEAWKGNDEIDALESEAQTLQSRIETLQQEIDDIEDEVEFVDGEIEVAETHLFEESSGFAKTLMQGIGSAWEYISGLAEGLTNATITALVLFIFKMLLLPILFLFLLIKLFKYVWSRDPVVGNKNTSLAIGPNHE